MEPIDLIGLENGVQSRVNERKQRSERLVLFNDDESGTLTSGWDSEQTLDSANTISL